MVAIVRDIRERIAQQDENDRIQTELLQKQKLESVGQLAAGLCYEINTPTQFIGSNIEFFSDSFQHISTFMEFLTEKSKNWPANIKAELDVALSELDWEYLDTEVPEAITQSKEGVDRVFTLVSAMKRFSHPGSKEKLPSKLSKIIDTALTVSRNEWKYIAGLSTNYDEIMPNIPVLTDEIRQVNLNMVINAAHAIQEKFGDETKSDQMGQIFISTEFQEDYAVLKIQDKGMGIPQDIIDKVFDPFFTTKTVGKGSGQGLAICHYVIVKKHNGKLEVQSEKNVGTTFIIHLPII